MTTLRGVETDEEVLIDLNRLLNSQLPVAAFASPEGFGDAFFEYNGIIGTIEVDCEQN